MPVFWGLTQTSRGSDPESGRRERQLQKNTRRETGPDFADVMQRLRGRDKPGMLLTEGTRLPAAATAWLQEGLAASARPSIFLTVMKGRLETN
jgi:hypothetical protein